MKISKINAASRADILKQRDEYDLETKKYEDQMQESEDNWEDALHEQKTALEKQISDIIGPTSIQLTIRVDPWGGIGEDNWSVNVQGNENNKFDSNVALAWHWSAKIDGMSGQVVKDSGSWSGLKAITPEQIEDLEESVRIIKVLNGMDWKSILSAPKAHFSDFVSDDVNNTLRTRRIGRPNFESDLETATIQEAIDSRDVAFALEQDSYFRGRVGIIPTGLTDKFIKGYIFPLSYVEELSRQSIIDRFGPDRRSSRSNLIKEHGDLVTYKLK